MGKLENKVALVTGGSRGIGKGISRGLVEEGANVIIVSRDSQALDQTAAELSSGKSTVLAKPADVADEEQVEDVFRAAVERFGRLDILVNNAGAFDGGPLEDLSVEVWDRVMAVNLRGPFLCTRAAMRIMKPRGGGRIINIGSISAQRVRPDSAPYSASKHGLWGLTQVTALEGREHGIVCSCLHPGNTLVERRRESSAEVDAEPMMTVDELARVAVTMATLPPHVNLLEAIVLPVNQLYVGRG